MRTLLLAFLMLQFTYPAPGPGRQSQSGLNSCAVLAYAMDEGSGSTFHDSSSSADNVTASSPSNFTWTANTPSSGITAPVWSGGASNAQASSGTPVNFTGTTPFSVAFWSASGFNGSHYTTIISTLNTSSGYQGWEIAGQIGSAGQPFTFFLINSYPSNYIEVNASNTVTGSPYYAVMTYDGSQTAAGVTLYLNGTALTTNVLGNSLSATAAGGVAPYIAQRKDGSDPMYGDISFLEVYNCKLTSTQISTYYARGPQLN